nr:TPA_asm: P2 protein [Pecan associated jivivirus 2]
MASISVTEAMILEQVVDPTTQQFADLMALLLKPTGDDRTPAQKLNAKSEWRYTLPYRGDSEDELAIKDVTPFKFAERASYRNGIASFALAAADVIDLVALSSNRRKMTPTVCVTHESLAYQQIMASAGNVSTLVFYSGLAELSSVLLQTAPEVVIFDHTTVMTPVDEVLNLAHRMGVHVVDGVFPYHVAAMRGWDIVSGLGKWSYTHSGNFITIGPDDDCSRLMKYRKDQYKKFLEPATWTGNSRKYGYEIRKCHNGLATYRAVYLGGGDVPIPREHLSYKLPLCSSDDMVMVTVNRDLAAGVFASKSNNAQLLSRLQKDYAIEVRRDLFVSCVDYLISRERGTDIKGEAVRYIANHNYVDLMEGVRVVRCPALSYADALCVGLVCALTAFTLRFRLTNESIPDVLRHKSTAQMLVDPPLGMLGRLVWLFGTYVSDAVEAVQERAIDAAKGMLYNSDYIPGVCYDVYSSVSYSPDLQWFEPHNLVLEDRDDIGGFSDDAFTGFMGDSQKTAAPTVFQERASASKVSEIVENKYVPNVVTDPEVVLQHFYDEALPGNSTAQLQNVAELRRVRDVNINTEFYGKVEINKDIRAKEQLHDDMPVRTAALPITSTPLLDAILASAKRNFNPPDLQMQHDPWEYARYLVDKFITWAFIPGFKDTVGKAYKKDPLSFNVQDYLEWLAMKDKGYRSALEAECPADLVELGLNIYDTIVKRRIKAKLNVSAQHELAQPQVIVSLSKKDTALFTSLFRKIFERFDHALRPEIKSAGRSSDEDISEWLSVFAEKIRAFDAIEIDSSKFDKSQGLLARMMESLLMQELGLDPGVSDIFSDSYVGKVSSRSLGLMFISAYQMKSGAPQTMLGNLIYNMISAMECVGTDVIELLIAKGDDNIVWVNKKPQDLGTTDKMSALFNLESKPVIGNVLYFSSGYVIPVDDRYYFVPDPLKLVELLGEIGVSPDTVTERYVSFRDRVSSLTREAAIVPVLQSAVRLRLGVPSLDVVSCVDALASMAASYVTFRRVISV